MALARSLGRATACPESKGSQDAPDGLCQLYIGVICYMGATDKNVEITTVGYIGFRVLGFGV